MLNIYGTSLGVQWLRLWSPNAGGLPSNPGQGTHMFLGLVTPCGLQDPSSLTKNQTCDPLQWKYRVLTTGLPGNSLNFY